MGKLLYFDIFFFLDREKESFEYMSSSFSPLAKEVASLADRFSMLRTRALAGNTFAQTELPEIFRKLQVECFKFREEILESDEQTNVDTSSLSRIIAPSTVRLVSDKNFFLEGFDYGWRDIVLVSFLSAWRGSYEKNSFIDERKEFYNLRSDAEYIDNFSNEITDGRFSEDRIFAFVDIETTSLDPLKGEIIEVGVVMRNGFGKVLEEFSNLYGTEYSKLSIGNQDIHGISADDLKNFPSFEKSSKNDLKRVLCDERITLVAHNADFEYKWLSLYLPGFYEAHTDDFGVQRNVLDTLLVSKILFDGTPDNKLSTFTEGCDVKYENEHRALPDAFMTSQSFFNFVEDFSKQNGKRSVFPLRS